MNNEKYEELDDLKKIKKEYGENMSHMCRDLFPTILEKPGLLYYIISTHFPKSRYLYDDIMRKSQKYDFKEYIYFLYDEIINIHNEEERKQSVSELLAEKGYTLYECKTNEDIQKFIKYYAKGEELCTFRDPKRINNHHIFFIVKNNVEEIKREKFHNPRREDEYSTSVLDLQFDKGSRQRVSIKSRYNHTVRNPDATYSNNLENIAVGLTQAFERDYGFNIGNEYMVDFELDHYVMAKDNKYYKYNYEINNIHYCPNNIIIDNGEVIDKYKDKSRYTIVDYFIIDKQEKKIMLYDPSLNDSFIDGLDNITNIEILNEDKCQKIKITQQGEREAIIKIDNLGRIIEYENNYITECGDRFLYENDAIQKLNLAQLKSCEGCFLLCNDTIQELNLPQLQSCGYNFLLCNGTLQEINLPQLQRCGTCFLESNSIIRKLNLPKLESCGARFLYSNKNLQELNLPQLQRIGNEFLYYNEEIQEVYLPQLQSIGNSFLFKNKVLQELSLPQLQRCGNEFLLENETIQEVNLPQLQNCGHNFLFRNKVLQELNLPELQSCGLGFVGYRFDFNSVKGVKKI